MGEDINFHRADCSQLIQSNFGDEYFPEDLDDEVLFTKKPSRDQLSQRHINGSKTQRIQLERDSFENTSECHFIFKISIGENLGTFATIVLQFSNFMN